MSRDERFRKDRYCVRCRRYLWLNAAEMREHAKTCDAPPWWCNKPAVPQGIQAESDAANDQRRELRRHDGRES